MISWTVKGTSFLGTIQAFLDNMNWIQLLVLVMGAVASLICLTIHELSHGYVAYRLGDPTAKLNGRLTLNPIAHLDWIGLFLMLAARVGWAKPVPVDMRNFKNPKQGMAMTALAGPVSNLLLSYTALLFCSAVYHFGPDHIVCAYIMLFFSYLAVLSVGLGLFNMIPIPPLDGSKVLFSLLPDGIYRKILRYERYVVLIVVLLAWSGIFSGPIGMVMKWVVRLLCQLSGFPFEIPQYYFF